MAILLGTTVRSAGNLILLTALMTGCRPVKCEVHIIPDAYVGPVVIVFGQSSGQELHPNNEGAQVFRIPTSGFLCVKTEAPGAGFYSKRFYYEAKSGRLRELPNDVTADVVQIFGEVSGVTGMLDGKETGELRWLAYMVGVPSSELRGSGERRELAVSRAERECLSDM